MYVDEEGGDVGNVCLRDVGDLVGFPRRVYFVVFDVRATLALGIQRIVLGIAVCIVRGGFSTSPAIFGRKYTYIANVAIRHITAGTRAMKTKASPKTTAHHSHLEAIWGPVSDVLKCTLTSYISSIADTGTTGRSGTTGRDRPRIRLEGRDSRSYLNQNSLYTSQGSTEGTKVTR